MQLRLVKGRCGCGDASSYDWLVTRTVFGGGASTFVEGEGCRGDIVNIDFEGLDPSNIISNEGFGVGLTSILVYGFMSAITPNLMCRNPGESPWLTCNCLTPLALVFNSQHSHNINIEHTTSLFKGHKVPSI